MDIYVLLVQCFEVLYHELGVLNAKLIPVFELLKLLS